MRRISTVIIALAFSMVLAGQARAAAPNHTNLITAYEGTKTCAACHDKAVKEVAGSLHYQHQAEPQFLENWEKGQLAGMMLSY